VEHPPAHRSEHPLPDTQRDPDDKQEDREDDQHDGQGAECRDPPDFARDLTGLGLGEFDMCQHEGQCGIAGRLELV
jgi:hypothetical protein